MNLYSERAATLNHSMSKHAQDWLVRKLKQN